MLNPTVRSPSSSSRASTSSMSANESASRSSVKFDSSLMRSSSISRISARWARRMRYTSSGPIGPWATCVSAGIDRLLEAPDDARLDALLGDAHRVDDCPGRGRAVRDHADAVDAEQDRPACQVGIEHAGSVEEQRREDLARLLRLRRRVDDTEHKRDGGAQRAFERLQDDVAGETVGHDDVDRPVHEVASLDVAVETGQLLEEPERVLAQLVALAGLLAVGEQADGRRVDAEARAGVLASDAGELGQPLGCAIDRRPAVDEELVTPRG